MGPRGDGGKGNGGGPKVDAGGAPGGDAPAPADAPAPGDVQSEALTVAQSASARAESAMTEATAARTTAAEALSKVSEVADLEGDNEVRIPMLAIRTANHSRFIPIRSLGGVRVDSAGVTVVSNMVSGVEAVPPDAISGCSVSADEFVEALRFEAERLMPSDGE